LLVIRIEGRLAVSHHNPLVIAACAGINPSHVLPVTIDVGTENEALLRDPYYLGLKRRRERGPAYDALVREFFEAAQDKFGPDVLIQFEDFGNRNAFRLLHYWQDRACTFNDDIQGTAAVALAGLIASKALTPDVKTLADHTFLFAGAGEAGTGIANLIAYAITQEDPSVSIEDARKKIFLVDSQGLVTKSRLDAGKPNGLQEHKIPFAHAVEHECPTLESAVRHLKPTGIIGVSAVPGVFNEAVVRTMAELNSRPLVFALSNPTSKAECTARQAYEWTDGAAIFTSGSPFDPVTLADGRRFVPGQGELAFAIVTAYRTASRRPFHDRSHTRVFFFFELIRTGNNAYIFPGIGLGHLAAGSTRITDHDMYVGAKTLAEQVTDEELRLGSLYPTLDRIREVSAQIAVAVAMNSHETGVAMEVMPVDMLEHVKSLMYDPFEDPFRQSIF